MINSVFSSLNRRGYVSQAKVSRQLLQRVLDWFQIVKKDPIAFRENRASQPYLTRAEKALGFKPKDSIARQQLAKAALAKLRPVAPTEVPKIIEIAKDLL